MSRSRDAWRLTALLRERLGRYVAVAWDPSRRAWCVEWSDGPGVEEMEALVGEFARQVPDVVEGLRFYRSAGGAGAWAVQLVRHVRAGGELLPVGNDPARLVTGAPATPAETARLRFEREHVEQPWADRPVDAEEGRLAEALMRLAPNEWEMWDMLAHHGLGVLGMGEAPAGVVSIDKRR